MKRYQRNEADIKKLDAKYGNLVSMIQGLGQKHQSMLPTKEEEESVEVEQVSNERVENWAKAVSVDGVGQEEDEERFVPEDDEDRESRFDRLYRPARTLFLEQKTNAVVRYQTTPYCTYACRQIVG